MDVTQLRYFLKTVETMNLTHAAESLFISRQALRQSLTALERDLGQELFLTDRNRLTLTQYGEYLALACVDALRAFDALEADVARFFRQEAPLRFAYSMSLTPYTLPGLEQFILRDFSLRFPHISLEATPCPAHQVIDLLESGRADCGCLLQMPTPRPEWDATVLRTSPVVIDSSPDSPFYGQPQLTLADLPSIPLIGMGELDRIAKPLWEDCRRLGLELNYRPVPSTIDALYLAGHNQASCLNTLPPRRHANDRRPSSLGQLRTILQGYTWELVLLCPKASPNHHAAQLLSSHIAGHYRHLFDTP